MAKSVIKEGYTPWTAYIKNESLKEIKDRAQKEGRTISYVANKVLDYGLKMYKKHGE